MLALGLLGLAVFRLRQGRRPRATLGFAIATLLGLYAGGVTPDLPDGQKAIENTADAFGAWMYPFAGVMAFLETSIPPLTLIFPGEFAVLFAGAVAGEGRIEIVPLVLLVWVCSALGDSVAFWIGNRFGRSFLLRYGRPLGINEQRLGKVDGWFDRYGAAVLAIGRSLPLARPLGPLVAGASRFGYRHFLPWNLVGTALFSLLFCGLGYVFYRSYTEAASVAGRVAFGVVLAVVATVLGVQFWRRKRPRQAVRSAVEEVPR